MSDLKHVNVRAKFFGRKKGALGITYQISKIFYVPEEYFSCPEQITNLILQGIYHGYEHVSGLSWKAISSPEGTEGKEKGECD